MILTFGVLCTMIKRCGTDSATNQAVVSAMVSAIDPNEKYREKTAAAKKAASRLVNCVCDFPAPSFSAEVNTNILSLLPDFKDAKAITLHFGDNVVPLIDDEKKRMLVLALQDVVKSDPHVRASRALTFQEEVGMSASEFIACQSFNLAHLLAGLFLYTVLIFDNRSGKDTVARISDDAYWVSLTQGFLALDNKGCYVRHVYDLHGLMEYSQRMVTHYKAVPTFLPGIAEFNFDDIFVCSNIEPQARGYELAKRIEDATIPKIACFASRVILYALGGNGKSMMLLHLLFDGMENMDSRNTIPLYVCLRHYSPETKNLIGFIANQVRNMWPGFDSRICFSLLKSNRAVLLLDGLDEMTDGAYAKFKRDLADFIAFYPDTQIIMAARPYADWIDEISGFRRARLCELTRTQALEFIDKINLYPNDPDRFNKFRVLVDKELYPHQKELTSNPLLLTAMMLVYHEDGEVPTQDFQFFDRVYDILSNSHDNTKGGFKRVFATGLDRRNLKRYLAEFAYKAYIAKAWTLSMDKCSQIYDTLPSRILETTPTRCEDFMTDVTKNLSIMYGEADTFNFYQHTFQEYFTAVYFANQPGSSMKNLIKFFESSRDRTLNDYVFPMLYGMRPSQVEESIVLPTLRKALKKREEAELYVAKLDDVTKKEAAKFIGYWSYVLNQYPVLEYRRDANDSGDFVISPLSVIVEYVLLNTKSSPDGTGHGDPIFHADLNAHLIPADGFIDERFYRVDGRVYGDQQDRRMLIALRDSGHEAVEVYQHIRIEIAQLLRCIHTDKHLLEYMESSDFPLMKEYQELRRHYISLTKDRSSSTRELRQAV